MPRKAKEVIEELKKEVTVTKKPVSKKATTTKKSSTIKPKGKIVKKTSTAKKEPATKTKKEVAKKSPAVKKESTIKSSKEVSKKSSTVKPQTADTVIKKTETKKTSKGKVSSETVKTAKKATAKKSTTSKKSTKTSKKDVLIDMPEYYDLPYRYNQTIIKILAQTPKMLFVYWDISEKDRQNYITTYGEDFFNNTIPFLRVKNDTDNYTFDIDVDDFANSWYIPIQNSKCKYSIELFRKQKPYTTPIINSEIYVATSNNLEVPNDHILFEKQQKMVYFKNVKTNDVFSKNVATLTFIKNIGKIYNIYELYQQIYQDEELDILSNPSSNPSSDSILNTLN